jgi:hypothetical protein
MNGSGMIVPNTGLNRAIDVARGPAMAQMTDHSVLAGIDHQTVAHHQMARHSTDHREATRQTNINHRREPSSPFSNARSPTSIWRKPTATPSQRE